MTVIAISKFRPHAGKANLVLQNMKDVASEFDKMGMTARISRDMLGPDAGCLTFSSFHENFTNSMDNLEKVFSSDWWAQVQMRLDDMCNKVNIKPVLLAPVTGEPMSSMVIGYGAESMNHAGKAIDEMGMSEEYQAMVRKGAALGELYRAWMSIPA